MSSLSILYRLISWFESFFLSFREKCSEMLSQSLAKSPSNREYSLQGWVEIFNQCRKMYSRDQKAQYDNQQQSVLQSWDFCLQAAESQKKAGKANNMPFMWLHSLSRSNKQVSVDHWKMKRKKHLYITDWTHLLSLMLGYSVPTPRWTNAKWLAGQHE